MAGSVNKCIIVGHLGADGELKHVNDQHVVNFRLATSEVWKDKQGNKQENTEWHRVQFWGKGAEAVAPFLTKGKLVYVEGAIHTRSYVADSEKKYVTEIRADKVTLLGGGEKKAESVMDGDPFQ